MSKIKLLHPVHTLDNLLLLPAGTVLSDETLGALLSSSETTVDKSYPLLAHGSVKEDLLNFLVSPPYHVIFDKLDQIANVINIMETANFALPILQSLDYFKLHDFYTYRHILVVFSLTVLMARDIFPSYRDLIQVIEAGPTHDFGKICIPLEILKKSDPLTLAERSILEHHAAAGFVLLSYYLRDTRNPAARVARDHHERRDCSGYPRGIPLKDRVVEIVAVCDIYDALISPRPYRPISYDNRAALEEITGMAERNEIGWGVLQILVAHNRKDKPHYSEVRISAERRGTPPPGNVYGVTAEEKEER